MEPIVVPNVGQEQFNAYLKQVGNEYGLTLPETNQGSYEAYGVGISWDYNPATKSVTLGVTKKPFWLPESEVESRLEGEIKKLESQP